MQDVEKLFRNIRDIKKEIAMLKRYENRLRELMLPNAIRYDKDSVMSSPQDPMSKYVERISDTEEKIRGRINKLQECEHIAMEILDRMPTSKYRILLSLRYIDGEVQNSWENIATYMGYDEHYLRGTMHKKALEEAQEIYIRLV